MTIEETKRKYEKKWLATPGVLSVGIGLNDKGEKMIKVGVDQSHFHQIHSIPEQVEGFPIGRFPSGNIKSQD